MNHTEAEYINIGYHYERGTRDIRSVMKMVESERVEDRAEARRLVERGRQEARGQPTAASAAGCAVLIATNPIQPCANG